MMAGLATLAALRRYAPTLALDALLAILSYTAALLLRFGGEVPAHYVARFPLLVLFAIILYAICSAGFRLHRRIWSFGSFDDLIAIAQAIGLGTLLLAIAFVVNATLVVLQPRVR